MSSYSEVWNEQFSFPQGSIEHFYKVREDFSQGKQTPANMLTYTPWRGRRRWRWRVSARCCAPRKPSPPGAYWSSCRVVSTGKSPLSKSLMSQLRHKTYVRKTQENGCCSVSDSKNQKWMTRPKKLKSRRDFNESRRDFNESRRDFNKSRRDFNFRSYLSSVLDGANPCFPRTFLSSSLA